MIGLGGADGGGWRRSWWSIALGMAAMGWAYAEDAVPAPAPAPSSAAAAPTEDPLVAARRQLDALKTRRSSPDGVSPSGVPQVALPDLPPAPASPGAVVLPTTEEEQRRAKRQENWLVDAMMNPKSGTVKSRDGSAPGDRRAAGEGRRRERVGILGEPAGSATGVADDAMEPDEMTDHGTSAERRSPEPKAADDANPFAKFLPGWVAPRDYALLQSTLDSDPARRPGTDEGLGARPVGSAVAGASPALLDSRPDRVARGFDAAKRPADNPYLQALTSPPLLPPPAEAVPNATYVPPPISAPPPVVEPAPARPNLPDFVKDTTDDKYYKPLKRF